MRSESQDLIALCNLFRDPLTSERYVSSLREERWLSIVELSIKHRVAPALWFRLKAHPAVHSIPAAARRKLENMYILNSKRNQAILRQTKEATDFLNLAGITPILLKGMATIAEQPPTQIGTFVTRDIDILVDKENFSRAVSILVNNGYTSGQPIYGVLHSHPSLSRCGELVPLDIHRDLGPQRRVISTEEAFTNAMPLTNGRCKAWVLSPSDRVLHLLFHDQVQDRRFELGRISIHQLLHFAYLSSKYDCEIDWDRICARLQCNGYGSVPSAYCHIAHKLLGIENTRFPRATWKARLHLQRCMVQLSFPILKSAVTAWETFTPYMSRNSIEYLYGPTNVLMRINRRAAYIFDILQRNHLRLFRKIKLQTKRRYKRI